MDASAQKTEIAATALTVIHAANDELTFMFAKPRWLMCH